VQSAGKRRQQISSDARSELAAADFSVGSLLLRQVEDCQRDNHSWSWIRDYHRPPSRQLPPELALFLDNHPDDVNTSRQQSPYNGSDAGEQRYFSRIALSHSIRFDRQHKRDSKQSPVDC
jgi:hypothetical protein